MVVLSKRTRWNKNNDNINLVTISLNIMQVCNISVRESRPTEDLQRKNCKIIWRVEHADYVTRHHGSVRLTAVNLYNAY